MISVSNLNKYYNKGKSNEIHVVNNISLLLPDVGFISILGKSGSGKTTLLNVLGGLDKATGTIQYDDLQIKNYDMKKIDKFRKEYIGYVFQNYNLLKSKTVWENLEIALEAINITDKEEVCKRIEYSLKAVGLYKFRKKPAFALSGGQMQRVSIARALVKNSKIIIADEPTGNLDSDNSVEIMNILKKISKKSLVLLVTHDKQLAEYYSDKIIELCDGKIEEIRETNSDSKLSGVYDSNKIYLEDFTKVEGEDENVKYHLFSDGDMEKLELTFIKKNNQIFLKSNQKIKLLEDSNLKIIEKRVETNKQNLLENFEFDTSFYSEKKSINIFKLFLTNLKNSIKGFFNTKKRTKFFHFAFFLIGIILAGLNITLVSYSKIDSDFLTYDKSIYGVEDFLSIAYDDELNEKYTSFITDAFVQGKITKFYTSNATTINTFVTLSSFDSRSISVNSLFLYDDLIQNDELLVGKMSTNDNELVLSQKLADQVIKKLDFKKGDYKSLLGKEIKYSYNKIFTIVGISKTDSVAGYFQSTKEINDDYLYFNYSKDDFRYISYRYAKTTYFDYEIVEGRDVSSNLECLVSNLCALNVGEKFNGITVVGKYKSQSNTIDDFEVVTFDFDENLTKIKIPFYYYNTELLIVNEATFSFLENFHFNGYNQAYFTVNDFDEMQNFAEQNGFSISNSYQILTTYLTQSNHQNKFMLMPVIIILMAITIIYIYFSTRSKMINDIYTIGVYRAIGFSRKRITAKYLVEILVTTILTSLLGYILVCIGYNFIATKFTDIGILLQTIDDYYTTYVLGVALLVTNIVFGLIPIVLLMRKTPSEIIAKYDI